VLLAEARRDRTTTRRSGRPDRRLGCTLADRR